MSDGYDVGQVCENGYGPLVEEPTPHELLAIEKEGERAKGA